jgi:hypothetical protein
MSKRMAALLMAAWCGACSGEDTTVTATMAEMPDETTMGDQPAGCYIIMEMMCDCDLEEAECAEEGVMVWVPAGPRGCGSCEM